MLDRIKALFAETPGDARGPREAAELALAVAVLLVEAARMDGSFDDDERATIRDIIDNRLDLGDIDPEELIAAAEARAEEAGELWSFARVAKNSYSYEDRVTLIEMLWEVAYADGQLHDYESNLLRRLSGLLYVTDQDSGAARKRVLDRLGLANGG